jgi:cytochrome c peroxidase
MTKYVKGFSVSNNRKPYLPIENPNQMKSIYLLPVLLLGFIIFLPSCIDDKITTTHTYYTHEEYDVISAKLDLPETPDLYDQFVFDAGNHISFVGTLGRVLFYDVNLSSDNSVSCGSCHKQHLAFSDDVPFSEGILNRTTARNSLALGVFRSFGDYSQDPGTRLFWDSRVDNLHDQMIETIGNPNEMGMQLEDIVEKIKDLDYYKILAKKAFGSESISEIEILIALEAFMNSIRSDDSRFDDVASQNPILIVGDPIDWNGFTPQENLGKKLFQMNCVGCHNHSLEEVTVDRLSSPFRQANNGLDLVYIDKGAGEFDPSPLAVGMFKIPSIRNIELTSPYMHDGRFATLEEVIDFYSEGIQDHQNLHPFLKENGQAIKFHFTENEKAALVQFLKTLTDQEIVSQAKLSDPFL